MISPYAIDGTDLWVETNLSAQNIMALTSRLLETFGHDPDAMQIEMK